MINEPGYLGQVQGSPLWRNHVSDTTAPYDPVEATREKAQAAKAMRSYEFINIAQQLDHLRVRLIAIDLNDDAEAIDLVIHDVIRRWDDERSR